MFDEVAHPKTVGGEEEPTEIVGVEGICDLDPDQTESEEEEE